MVVYESRRRKDGGDIVGLERQNGGDDLISDVCMQSEIGECEKKTKTLRRHNVVSRF